MNNNKEKLSNGRCSLVSGGNASGTHYIYQCPNCGKGEIAAFDGKKVCNECGAVSEEVDEVYLDLDSDHPNYGVSREIMDKYNIKDF